jgi:hypothetical protein
MTAVQSLNYLLRLKVQRIALGQIENERDAIKDLAEYLLELESVVMEHELERGHELAIKKASHRQATAVKPKAVR